MELMERAEHSAGGRMEMYRQRDEKSLRRSETGISWAVSAPPASLHQSSLLFGMPVLYHQSSVSSLLFVATAEQQARSGSFSGEGRFRRNFLSIPTQLLMPDGGVALGMPPRSVAVAAGSISAPGGGAASRNEDANGEGNRMSALRNTELAVILTESPESRIRSRRSRLLLLLAMLLSLQYFSVFAIIQGKDTPSIFLPGVITRLASHRLPYYGQLVLGQSHYYATLRQNFYMVAVCLCLLLPLLVFSALVGYKRQMEALQTNTSQQASDRSHFMFPSRVPSTSLSIGVVVFSALVLFHGIFVVRTYFDIIVFFLFIAIRGTLNRLVSTCFAPHLMLTKAGTNI